ncbi:MAG: tetratricopeptide repeat protein [Woeseiaceae bacterium]|nr:tetratricopeptide repeat protein [Woeseiaceae bacterium]
MTKHWHVVLLLFAIALGVVVLLWPTPADLPESAPPAGGLPGFADAQPVPEPAVDDEVEDAAAAVDGDLTQQAVNAVRVGDVELAMTLFEQAIDTDPADADAYRHYGRLLTRMVAYERAVEMLERARDLQPNDAQAWLDLATVYERSQQFQKSWDAQAKAREIVGSDAITRDESGRFVVSGTMLD